VIPKKLKYFPWMSREAIKKSKDLGSIRNSITSGGGNLAGYLGEIALARHLKADNISCDEGNEKYNYDLLKSGKKIEVKTKRRTRDVEGHYEVSIAATSKHQKTDVYAFISITFDRKEGKGRNATYHKVKSIWLCGYMAQDEYFKKAKYMRKGQIDISNGFRVHANMYNMPISELKSDINYDL